MSKTSSQVSRAAENLRREFSGGRGLQQHRPGYYSPQIGRWTSQDPLGYAAGDSNLYRYVGNGPANYIDPSGAQEQPLKTTNEKFIKGVFNGKYGPFEYKFTQVIVPGPMGLIKEIGELAELKFTPAPAAPDDKIVFIQVITNDYHRLFTREGTFPSFPGSRKEQEYYEGFSADPSRGTMLDHLKEDPSPFANAKWKDRKGPEGQEGIDYGWVSQRGKIGIPDKTPATLRDTPKEGYHGFYKEVVAEFETAAYSLKCHDVRGVIRWGYTVTRDKNQDAQLQLYIPAFSQVPSETFRKHCEIWNKKGMQIKIDYPNNGGISALPKRT